MSRRARSLWRKIADGLLFVILAGGVILLIRQFGADPVYSSIKVVDGDSLRDGAEDIRLDGIDAPEYRQTCSDAAGKEYSCGKRAAQHLRKLVGRSEVTCQIIDTDRYGRTVAVCSAGGTQLNRAMVEAGWATSYTRHSLGYAGAERAAKQARRGIWQGRFENPEDWRDAHRAGLASGQSVPD